MKPLGKIFWPNQMLYFFYRHKALSLTLLVGVLLFAVAGIFRLELEADTRKFLPRDTAERLANEKIRQLYGIDSEIVIAYSSTLGLPVTDATVMSKIQELSDSLRNLGSDLISDNSNSLNQTDDETDTASQPLVQDLQALHTVSLIYRVEGGFGLEQQDIGPAILQDGIGNLELQQNLRRWGLYNKGLHSDDFRYGAIIIQPRLNLSSAGHQQLYDEIVALLDSQNDEIRFFLSGEDIIQSVIGTYIMQDLMWLIPLLGLIICAVLLAYFHRFAALFIILFPVLFALLLTIGLMGWLGVKFTFIHASIPVIIMALGSADSIHSLSHYLQLKISDKLRRIAMVQRQLFTPISLTSLTTSVAFLSFSFSVMLPIRSFGLFNALGIGLAWLASVFITPLLLPLYRSKMPSHKAQPGTDLSSADQTNTEPPNSSRQKTIWLWRCNLALLRHPYLSRSILVLLWSFPEKRTGGRLRLNSFCGINLAAHALSRRKIGYSYLHGLPGDTQVQAELLSLGRAAKARAGFQNAKMLVLGQSPEGFDACDYNAEEIQKTFGVGFHNIPISDFIKEAQKVPEEIAKGHLHERKKVLGKLDELEQEPLLNTMRVYHALDALVEEQGAIGAAVRCWPQFFTEWGTAACGALAMMGEKKIPCGCEADVYGVLTSKLLSLISDDVVFNTDLVDLDFESNTCVFWHCGQAPIQMADPDSQPVGTIHTNRKLPLLSEFPLKPGQITIARLSRGGGELKLVLGQAEMLKAPLAYAGTSGVARFPKPLKEVMDAMMQHGLEHHTAIVYGDYLSELRAFARLLDIATVEL